MEKSIHNIVAYMIAKDIVYKDLSGFDIILMEGEFNLTDKQLRGLIIECYKNGFGVNFENNKFYVTQII